MQLSISLCSAWIGTLAGLVFAQELLLLLLLLLIIMGRGEAIILVGHKMVAALETALTVKLAASIGTVRLQSCVKLLAVG